MIYSEDTAHVSGNPGGFVLGVRNEFNQALANNILDYSPLSVDSTGCVITIPKRLATYSSVGLFTAASAATDIFTITGAGSVVRINRIRFYGVQTTSSVVAVHLVKRSTANTGGTSTTPTIVQFNSADAAPSAVVRAYTANPTLGTLVGVMDVMICEIPAGGSIVDANVVGFDFGNAFGNNQPTLHGTSEVLAINLNGATITGNILACVVEWTES